MLIVMAAKYLSMGLITITLSGGAIGTGVLFAGYNVGASKNPEEAESLFNTSLMAFALIETFIFIGLLVIALSYIL